MSAATSGTLPDSTRSASGRTRAALGLLFLLFMGQALFAAWQSRPATHTVAPRPLAKSIPLATLSAVQPVFQRGYAPATPAKYVHSSTAVETTDGKLLTAWYAGEEEGTRDTRIFAARLDLETGAWGELEMLLDRHELAAGLQRKIKKLGNPLLVRLPDQKLGLMVVSTAAFGWAASNINLLSSNDEGRNWHSYRQLQLSPWFNISTLVRGSGAYYEDGDLMVPVYHEFMGKFGEILRINDQQEIVAKKRLTWGRDTLQPALVARAEDNGAVAFLRSAARDVHRVTMVHRDPTTGRWGEPVVTDLPNPNAGLDALRLRDGSILLAFNDHPVDRSHMSLARSWDNGSTWRRLAVIEQAGPKPHDVSYPTLTQTSNGDYHLFYSRHTQRIRHVRFNQAWLDAH